MLGADESCSLFELLDPVGEEFGTPSGDGEMEPNASELLGSSD